MTKALKKSFGGQPSLNEAALPLIRLEHRTDWEDVGLHYSGHRPQDSQHVS